MAWDAPAGFKKNRGIGRKFGERGGSERAILRRSVMQDSISPIHTDEHKIGGLRFRASFGATGNMRGAGEMRARQNIRKTPAIAAGVEGS
jgi:hypothetical protein